MTAQLATIIGSTTWPISLADARDFVIIDDDDDDHMRVLQAAIAAATAWAESHSGLTAQRRTYQLRLDHWRDAQVDASWRSNICYSHVCSIAIPAAPVRDVLSVTYVDPEGIEQTVSEADYSWERTPEGAIVAFVPAFSFPQLRSGRHGVVRVLFDAGFDAPDESGSGDDPELTLPPQLVMAISQVVARFYENRQPDGDALSAARVLLDQIRVYR